MASQGVLVDAILPVLKQFPRANYAQIQRYLQREGIHTSRQRVQQIAGENGLDLTREQVQLRRLTRLERKRGSTKNMRRIVEQLPEDMLQEFLEAIAKPSEIGGV